MAKRRSETTENQGMQAPKSSLLESLSLRSGPANPHQSSHEGFARLKTRLKKMMEYSEPRIYFGCTAVKDESGAYKPVHLQPKSLSNEWYITWNHYHPKLGKKKQVRRRLGINRFHTLEEKLSFALDALLEVQLYLKEKNNPWIEAKKETNLKTALQEAFVAWKKRKKRADQTEYDYESALNAFIEFGGPYLEIPVKDVKRMHVREILDKIQDKREIGNTRYNFIKGVIRTLFGEIIELGYAEINPLADMAGKKKEAPKPQPFTPEEKKLIRDRFIRDPFFAIIGLLYYAGIRPGEQRKLIVADIDLKNNEIYLDGKKTKSSNARVANIPPPLKPILSKHIQGSDPNWYVFGNEDFSPSGTMMAEKRTSKYWLKHVKAEAEYGGLGIDKDMYWLKHTAGDDLLDADVDEAVIRELYGHTAVRMTKKYLSKSKTKQAAFRKISSKIKEFGT